MGYGADQRNTLRDIQECDLVIGVKRGKIIVIKDRDGELYDDLSLSDVFERILLAINNDKLTEALTPVIEKIKLYETFR